MGSRVKPPKVEGKDAGRAGRPATGRKRSIAVTMKGSPEWKEWVEAGARFCRTDVAKLLDVSVIEYLKSKGFNREAPER